MAQSDFAYQSVGDSNSGSAAFNVYTDRSHILGEIVEDLRGSGLRVAETGDVAKLLDGNSDLQEEFLLLDCPSVDAERLAALARLDMRLASNGIHTIVNTSIEALDAVFAAFDQSNAQILVDASRAERIIAIGRAISNVMSAGVRELAEEDRLMLLRLSQQVEMFAQRLDGFGEGRGHESVTSYLGENRDGFRGFEANHTVDCPDLPDPHVVRRFIRHRQARGKFFDPGLFADPAWDMLLDLTAARAEGSDVAVTSLCIASGVPATTALRWIKQMVESGLFVRVEDSNDRRRAFIRLSESAADAMARYFAEISAEKSVPAAA